MSDGPSFTFTPTALGGHVRVTVRCGAAGQRAFCGELTLNPAEWAALQRVVGDEPIPVEQPAEHDYFCVVVERHDGKGTGTSGRASSGTWTSMGERDAIEKLVGVMEPGDKATVNIEALTWPEASLAGVESEPF